VVRFTKGAGMVTVGILELLRLNLYKIPIGSDCQLLMVKSKLTPVLSGGIHPVVLPLDANPAGGLVPKYKLNCLTLVQPFASVVFKVTK